MLNSKIDYQSEIIRLKKELDAIILAHYYQLPEIQDIADYIGDSLELAKHAKSINAKTIVFCGVYFMAETAKILNPEKTVLLPDLDAGCSLEESCQPHLFEEFIKKHPNSIVVTYINSSAEIKALSDIICTSSNAEKIISHISKDKKIIFAPDKNLGHYLAAKTKRELILWEGSCEVHEIFSETKIKEIKFANPKAKIIAHPECEEIVLKTADFIGSTSKLLKFISEDDSDSYIVATEPGIIHQMKKIESKKLFIPAPSTRDCSCNECRFMKLNTIEKLYYCMKNKSPQATVSDEIRSKALAPIERMLELSL